MIEFVAFDFDHEILLYRDGKLADHIARYQYDHNEELTFAPFLPTIRALAPGAPVYHLPHAVFMEAAERRKKRWNYAFVLELARKQGQI